MYKEQPNHQKQTVSRSMFPQSCNLLQVKLGWEDCKNTMLHSVDALRANRRLSAKRRLLCSWRLACTQTLRDVWEHSTHQQPKQKMHTMHCPTPIHPLWCNTKLRSAAFSHIIEVWRFKLKTPAQAQTALLFEGLSDSGSQTANAAPPELLHRLGGQREPSNEYIGILSYPKSIF